jgi:hypothetical protein
MFPLLLLAGASAAMQAYSGYQQYKGQEAMSEYNAKVAENEALAAQQAIRAEQAKMTRGQRSLKATQRMSVASRGGTMAGTDMMTLAEEAKMMQLDQLELQRQQDLAGIRGASEAAMSRYQGAQAKMKGRWTVGTALMQGVGTYASLGGKFGGAKTPEVTP